MPFKKDESARRVVGRVLRFKNVGVIIYVNRGRRIGGHCIGNDSWIGTSRAMQRVGNIAWYRETKISPGLPAVSRVETSEKEGVWRVCVCVALVVNPDSHGCIGVVWI